MQDRLAAQLAFYQRAASRYDAAAVLAREVASRMAERLSLVKNEPSRILDLGCGTGADERLLRARYPKVPYFGLDASMPMLCADASRPTGWRKFFGHAPARVCGLAQGLPFKSSSIGMVWSNFFLHQVEDPLPVFRELHRVLEVEGWVMFSCLGPDSLKELRAVAPARVHRFIDMHDLGDMLVAAGFAEPVMDMETITLTYAELDDLVADLRGTGGCFAAPDRARGLMGKGAARAWRERYEAFRRERRLPASFEIVYGHAWKPQPKKTAEGHAIVRFDTTKRGRG